MEYISTKEASEKWGISPTRITILANEGRIPDAQRVGRNWLIPANASKPAELKGGRGHALEKVTDSFSFPLYFSRPDWNKSKEEKLSPEEKTLLLSENAIMECRFADAYSMLEKLKAQSKDITIEIGYLWALAICCIGLNKPEEFLQCFLRLQLLLSDDIPHRSDLTIILEYLKTYIEPLGSTADNAFINTDIHQQVLPLISVSACYIQLTKELMKSGSADVSMLELNLRYVETTSSIFSTEMMHLYLSGIYTIRQCKEDAEKHAKAAIRIAYENKIYLPLVTYYSYNSPLLSTVLEQFPEEFKKHCLEMNSQYIKSFNSVISSLSKNSAISKISNSDYPYILGVLNSNSNAQIAEKIGVSYQTVIRRLDKLCEKLELQNKNELKAFLIKYI